jgi:hypothetical protein
VNIQFLSRNNLFNNLFNLFNIKKKSEIDIFQQKDNQNVEILFYLIETSLFISIIRLNKPESIKRNRIA